MKISEFLKNVFIKNCLYKLLALLLALALVLSANVVYGISLNDKKSGQETTSYSQPEMTVCYEEYVVL